MLILLNPFKSQLCVLSLIAFLLLFIPVLTANELAIKPTNQSLGWVERSETQQSNPKSEVLNPQLDKASFALKTAKLHMPFIANNGQMDEQVKFYAKTFGGTVFVTKEGEIVYALPMNSSKCRGEWHSPNGIHDEAGMLHDHHISDILHPASWIVEHDKSETCGEQSRTIQNDALCHPECNEGSVTLKRDSSPSAQNDREESTNRSTEPLTTKSETCGEQSRTIQNIRAIALKEELVGAKVKAIQGEEPSVTKVNYFKGNDPSKWKTNISTYDSVNLGEIYDGIELKLRAYGNNVEKLFCVKPGADPEQIKIRLSGAKDCGVQKAEITHPLVPSREGINPKSDASTSLSMTSFRAESRNQNPKLSVNEQGELEVETELGLVKFTKPVAYQEKNGKRVEVECKYTIADCGMQNAECKTNLKSKIVRLSAHDEVRNPNSEIKNLQSEDPKSQIRNPKSEYGFKVASYDKTKPLIIDPLLASTYLGGSDDDYGYSLTLDTSGNVYVTGSTYSSDFPTTSGAYDTSQNGSNDVFVSKLDGGLSSLLASTYLGGSSTDYGYSLALDTSGNVYVMGTTYSTDFPTTSGAYDTSYYNGYDIFVSKLDGGLSSLLASTYLGGSRRDDGNSLTLDTSGNVYVMGLTDSTDFPTTSGAYDTSFNGNSSFYDVFISKLNGGLTSLLASTYLGGGNDDYGNALTLDTSGHVYVTGNTNSIDFPTTNGAYDTSYNGGWMDVFISKLDGGLTTLLASTYLGGSYDDEGGRSLTLDTSGNVYVMGYTVSINFPTTSGAYDTSYNGGGDDVVVSKLNGGLSSLLASTYLGGSGGDWGWSSLSLALDTSGNVYVMGLTDSTDFPTTSGAYDTSYNGDGEENDSFISKLDGELTSLLASTYLGGSDSDYCYAINLDTNGNVYVTGETDSTDFPTTSGAYDTSFNGSVDYYYRNYYDVFVSKLDSNLLSCAAAAIEASPNELTLKKKQSDEVTVTVTGEDGCPVEGDTVKAKVEGDGNQYIKVSPKKQKTDANGQAMFTIKAKDKAGNALVIFRDGSLNTQVSVKVVK